MNTKYNSLLLAEESLKRAEFLIDSIRIEDYSGILPVFHPIDTIETAIASEQLEQIIKLTSQVAERHSNSRFLDRSYVLLGIARFYKGDFLNAIEVFKYVNSNGTDVNEKHSALIWLMHAYMESGNMRDALGVSALLGKETLTEKNRAHFFEVNSFLNQKNNSLPLSVAFLDEANKLLKKSKRKGRNLFIVGQMYDALGQKTEARKNWLKVTKNKPNYELEFNTNIELLMSNSLAGSDANFDKMLEDRKNSDLKDKIYFKKGQTNVQKELYPQAIKAFQQSASLATNKTSKASAYLQIAETNYKYLSNYEMASMYYDSTLQNINPKASNFQEISDKSKSLTDFVTYMKVLKQEDSLQNLATMNPLELENMVEEMLKEQEKELKRLEDEAKTLAAKKEAKNASAVGSDVWFMYNQAALTRSRSAFVRQWGNRPLEDNWRRKDKEAGQISFKIERGIVGQEEEPTQEDKEEEALAQRKAEFEAKKKEILAKIPNSQQQLAQSQRRQEEAYYQLGKIYKLQFNEPDNAKKMFVDLLDKFPDTVYEQEVLYFLSLMSDNIASNQYRTRLLDKHPFSSYARQLKRGNVEINADTESNAERAYQDLYALYQKESYKEALVKANGVLLDYTGTSIEDKIAMLRIFLLAKTADLNAYRIALLDFTTSYPSSKLAPKANEMLAVLNKN